MKIRVTAIITVGAGQRLGLSPAQAGARAHLLTQVGDGVYELTGSTQFKVGEELTWLGSLDKFYQDKVEELDRPAREAEQARRATSAKRAEKAKAKAIDDASQAVAAAAAAMEAAATDDDRAAATQAHADAVAALQVLQQA